MFKPRHLAIPLVFTASLLSSSAFAEVDASNPPEAPDSAESATNTQQELDFWKDFHAKRQAEMEARAEANRERMSQHYEKLLAEHEQRMQAMAERQQQMKQHAEEQLQYLKDNHEKMLQEAIQMHEDQIASFETRKAEAEARSSRLALERAELLKMTPEERQQHIQNKLAEIQANRPAPPAPPYPPAWGPRYY